MKDFKCKIKCATHEVCIKTQEGRIHIFKYNNRTCDFGVFDNQFDATEFILEPLPTYYYQVTVYEQ
jgi:hypothetical protein